MMAFLSSFHILSILLLTWTALYPAFGRVRTRRENGVEPAGLGCFKDHYNYSSLPYVFTSERGSLTSEECKEICLQHYFRYAFIKDVQTCYCGSSYSGYSIAECPESCKGNESKFCPNAVLDTGQIVPGPPASLELFNATNTSVQAVWSPPIALNDVFTDYIVVATAISTSSKSYHLESMRSWTYPNATLKTELPFLHPGTEYNISVATKSDHGIGVNISDTIWTEIGEPEEPALPRIKERKKTQMVIELQEASNENGPISAYHIVVIYGGGLVAFSPDMLKSYEEANKEGLQYYIAAELPPETLKDVFVVGDGRTYRKYNNPPLHPDSTVHVTVGVVSSWRNVTKATYAKLSVILSVVDNISVATVGVSGLVIGLSVAIFVFGSLLLLSVVAYCMLRRHLGRRRRNPDHQELSLQGPMIEVEPNGYIHNGFIPEEEDERVNHYENLKRQVWNIPRNFLDVKSEVLGRGQYGNVMRGTVQQKGFPVPVAIHTIADGELPPEEKRSMLQDLGTLIRVGMHTNIISLVGTCENPDTLFVVVEHHPASLKDVLLESRSLEHSVTPFSVQTSVHSRRRVCSLAESHVLEVAVGIARAMDYLTTKKIIHTQLAARNVLMADGVVPKVTGCGISRYVNHRENPDYTRWTAQEIFRGRPPVSKSDVWSFGCVLWEISALGGTPYADIVTSEVASRVMRGQRLPQLQFVDDDLYQLMLQCWQLDLDERPTFQEITHILENMLEDSAIHLNFEMYAGFHYEQYIAELEQTQS
ncbi:putative inactive tyrosine-protein kinase Wsck [Periplaneta americana]|uniref:putative inactive tyrosine-protein kinase Wsck n=1 Tax=Periplaneta americana TaxID=6978 RepID=UPI0037E7407F